jgi:hypothetical protein
MIWPFTKKTNTNSNTEVNTYKVPEFKQVAFGKWLYAPAPDITAYELAMLAPVFGTVMVRNDIRPYIKENNLTRHFKIPAEE